MKKKHLKKLSLKTCCISNLESNTVTGGHTCESPCQGGTNCCSGLPCATEPGYTCATFGCTTVCLLW